MPSLLALATALTLAAGAAPNAGVVDHGAQNGATTVTATPPGAPEQAAPAQTADEAFNTRVKTLEEEVADLKEKIFRSKARLLLLQQTVLGGDISSGAKAVLVHRNEMGGTFVLESVAYALDGAAIYNKVDQNGDLANREEIEIFNGRIVPGQHQVSVRLAYKGHGYGVFSYLEGYKFKVQSSYTFTADAGKITNLKIVGFEKGGVTTELKDRPSVRYDLSIIKEGAMRPTQQAADAH